MSSPNTLVAALAVSRVHRVKPRLPAIIVSPAIRKLSVAGKAEALKSNKLVLQKSKAVPTTGNRPLALHTKVLYEQNLSQLEEFLTLLGDYELLLLLDNNSPQNCIAMNVESLVLFIQFKQNPKDSILTNLAGEAVKDVVGEALKCQGTWKNPKIVDHLTAAVKLLHQSRGHNSSYQEPCPYCIELPIDEHYKGCVAHSGQPRLQHSGNPCNNIIYTNTVAQLRQDGKGYLPQGSNFVTPKDLRHLQKYLCYTGCVWDLQTYVMLLLGVKLFLRHDEYFNIEIDHSEKVQKRYVVNENGIQRLCLEVTGKCNKIPQQLYLWADNKNPVICPVRFLLLYLKVAGIKKGYLFPTFAKLTTSPPTDGHFKTQLSNDALAKCISTLLMAEVLKRDNKVGCHTRRKLAYLFAVWGGGIPKTTMLSARHKTVQAVQEYRKGANTLAQILLVHKDPEQLVSKWKPIHCQSRVCLDQLNVPLQQYIKPLHDLAVDFVVGKLGVLDGKHESKQISSLVLSATSYRPKVSIDLAFERFLEANVSATVMDNIMRYHNQVLQQHTEKHAIAATTLVTNGPTQDTISVSPELLGKGKKKCGGE